MMTKEKIKLVDCPEKLQASVNSNLKNFPKSEILDVQKYVSTPYKDKTITDTTYKVFILYGNVFEVFRLSTCSKEEWNDRDVEINKMIAGEIAEIISLSPEWFSN